MKHPSEYATTPLGGLHVMVVDTGTVIKNERTKEEIEVTDTTAARKGNVIFCTQKTYDEMKRQTP